MEHFLLPKGFMASGIHSGVKKKRKDLALIFSLYPCNAAGMFTTNTMKAAPVIVCERKLAAQVPVRAVVVNSGNANCMTGQRGIKDAEAMATRTAELLDVPENSVLVSSTGIIGQFMPIRKILGGMKKLIKALSREGLGDAAEGISTTDGFNKIEVRKFKCGGKEVTISGIAKGAGMIQPNMATMLCYIVTDVDITRKALEGALRERVADSFNAITVDGDMSTNDSVIVMANGAAGNRSITGPGRALDVFTKNIGEVMLALAKMIVRDGEGATKMIETRVKGAVTKRDAKKAAEAIASSLLVRCAVLGGDPNWGRVASSIGASGVKVDPEKMVIRLDGVTFYKNGRFATRAKRRTSKVFKGRDVTIEVDLCAGSAEHVVYSCDISKKYITLNSYYTT